MRNQGKIHGKGKRHGQKRRMLNEIASGCRARIRCHHATGAIRQRLLDLGFVPQTEIDVIRRAPLGDPIECKVANYSVALRGSEASFIEVDDEDIPKPTR